MKKLFTEDWQFSLRELGTFDALCRERNGGCNSDNDDIIMPASLPDGEWKDVDVPHDWQIFNSHDLYKTSEGWYRKKFFLSSVSVSDEPTADLSYALRFDGVYMDSTVYVNGKKAVHWRSGYSTFETDISHLVQPGENDIFIVVRYDWQNCRWYSGAGIYRSVYFLTRPSLHLSSDGVYFSAVCPSFGDSSIVWTISLDVDVEKPVFQAESVFHKGLYSIRFKMTGADGELLVMRESSNTTSYNLNIPASDDNYHHTAVQSRISEIFSIDNPRLWSLSDPYYYTLETQLLCAGAVIDSVSNRVGFKTAVFTTDKGFFLNGVHVKLHGVCMHHDLGSLGSSFNPHALKRQLRIMQQMGVNAVRTSHNMPAPELMDICDEIGMLVVNEAFDVWERTKTTNDYAKFFPEAWKRDVRSWITRDRNHPSLIMWSIGNEIYDTHITERGLEVTKLLRDEVSIYDPRKNAPTTIGSNYIAWDNAQKCSNEIDISGYNYGEHLYTEHHAKYPHWKIYGSETGARVQSRGIYHFPAKSNYLSHDDLQCSSLLNCRSGDSDRTAEDSIVWDRDCEFCAGQFIWSGFDYIGEPTPYHTKNAYYGQVDTAGFPKDSFYLYQSSWMSMMESPVLHIMPYWDFNEGQLIDVMVFSNIPYVELFLNGKTLGVQHIDHVNGKVLHAHWIVPYEKGTITAVGYDSAKNEIKRDERTSFGCSSALKVSASKTRLTADGEDLVFLEITAHDETGNPVENARDVITVHVEGPAYLAGLDNGDSSEYDQYKGRVRRLFSGKLLAIVGSTNTSGTVKITVTSPGLKPAAVTLLCESSDITRAVRKEQISVYSPLSGEEQSAADYVPVRKIELSCSPSAENQAKNENEPASPEPRMLGPGAPSVRITAKILPDNASCKDIDWSAVINTGVRTNTADCVVSDDGMSAVITAKGDGSFRVRCSASNGRTHPEVISELEFTASGLGEALLDPYKFISASLYNRSDRKLDECNEGGVLITKEMTYIGFAGVDFGEYGSDTFTLPLIRWFENEKLPFQVWDGLPYTENSSAVLLAEFEYQADFQWLTYKENTFTFKQRLKGVKTICFALNRNDNRVSFKGFSFKKYNKAYEKNFGSDCTRVFGDTFIRSGECIEHIGNNVTVEFENMDFIDGVSKVTICGRSHNENDSIHIHVTADGLKTSSIAEFPHSKEYIEKTFEVRTAKGRGKASFVFLPGCNFDMRWIQFHA